MNKLSTFLPILLASLLIVACGEADTPEPSEPAPAEQPAFEADIDVIEIEVNAQGYAPEQIELQEGVPTQLVFTRTADSVCAEYVQSPELGVGETELPLDEPVAIELTPSESGAFTFMCGMDMLEGTIVVSS